MFCTADGQPDPAGDFQLIDGKVCLRDGRRVSFDLMFRDAASTAKTGEPTSIDEALAQAFKQSAEAAGFKGDVSGWIAKLEPKKLDEFVAQVATAFVRGHAGAGVGKHFATDTLDAELTYRLAAARAKHDLAQASKPSGQRSSFTATDAASVVAKVTATRVGSVVQHTDAASELERLRSEAAGARAARKHQISNAWRRS